MIRKPIVAGMFYSENKEMLEREIVDSFNAAKSVFDKPTVIIAHTIAGKGVKEFERDYRWHGKAPSKEEAKRYLTEMLKNRAYNGNVRRYVEPVIVIY